MRVVMVVLAAFPNDVIDRRLTPSLERFIDRGGWQPEGGIGELTAAAYPNLLSFVTGCPASAHGVLTERATHDVGPEVVGGVCRTLFDACREAGRSSLAVVGDQRLVPVCGANRADRHWPADGVLPPNVSHSLAGTAADHEVVAAVARSPLDELDFLFVQLDEIDGARHGFGPASEPALDQIRRTDAAFGVLVELLRPWWGDTVMFVVSDHDHEVVADAEPIDLARHLPPDLRVVNQGTAAHVIGPRAVLDLRHCADIDGVQPIDDCNQVVWGPPGRVFGATAGAHRGEHGSPRTRRQVAAVGGGHPAVGDFIERLARARPRATTWASWTTELLELAPGSTMAGCATLQPKA